MPSSQGPKRGSETGPQLVLTKPQRGGLRGIRANHGRGVRATRFADSGIGSLYALLETKYRLPIEWAEEEIRATRADDDQARWLRLAPGDTVLVMERVSFTRDNRPVEFVRGVYSTEQYRLSIRLKR